MHVTMVEYSEKCCINICKRLLISFHFVKTDMYLSIISICIIVFFSVSESVSRHWKQRQSNKTSVTVSVVFDADQTTRLADFTVVSASIGYICVDSCFELSIPRLSIFTACRFFFRFFFSFF